LQERILLTLGLRRLGNVTQLPSCTQAHNASQDLVAGLEAATRPTKVAAIALAKRSPEWLGP
jgi:hypothetical protein